MEKPEALKDFVLITDGTVECLVTNETWSNIIRRQDFYLSDGDTQESGFREANEIYKSFDFTVYNAGTLAKYPFYRRWSEVIEPNQGVTEGCPKCGHMGEFVRMALCCPTHGVFGGC